MLPGYVLKWSSQCTHHYFISMKIKFKRDEPATGQKKGNKSILTNFNLNQTIGMKIQTYIWGLFWEKDNTFSFKNMSFLNFTTFLMRLTEEVKFCICRNMKLRTSSSSCLVGNDTNTNNSIKSLTYEIQKPHPMK